MPNCASPLYVLTPKGMYAQQVHPYRFHTLGIKQCSPDESTIATQRIFPPESTSPDAFMFPGVYQDTLPAKEAWRLLVHAGGV